MAVEPPTPGPEDRTHAPPLSYVGITRRTAAWVRRRRGHPAAHVAGIAGGVIFLILMYALLAAWYIVALCLRSFALATRAWMDAPREYDTTRRGGG